MDYSEPKTAPDWHTIWYTNLAHQIICPNFLLLLDLIMGGADSNLRLPPCEDGTLTAELAARLNWT